MQWKERVDEEHSYIATNTFNYFWKVIVSELVRKILAIRILWFNIKSFKFTLSNCFYIFKTHKQKSITNNSWRLNRIPQKWRQIPRKKTWRNLSDYNGVSLLNSMKIQLYFRTLLKTKNNFLTEKILKTIRKIQLYHTYTSIRPNSINAVSNK